MKEYSEIETAKELLQEVAIHGLKIDTDSIIRAQDILGHSGVHELVDLANDPKYGREFYNVAFRVWHWEDAVRFYNQNSNTKEREAVEERDRLSAKLREMSETCQRNYNNYLESLSDRDGRIERLEQRIEQLTQEAEEVKAEPNADQTQEILVLKARLYDLEHSDD